jgi:hypothetical protein
MTAEVRVMPFVSKWFALFPLSLAAIFAQTGLGFRVGVAANDLLKPAGYIGSEPFQANTKRLIYGPTLDFQLPRGFGIVADFLHKSHEESGGAIHGGVYKTTESSWEFPLLAKYRFSHGRVRPYIEGGPTFNRLGGYLTPYMSMLATPSEPQPKVNVTRKGFAAGAGLEFKLGPARLMPAVRFSHWRGKDTYIVPGANTADVLLGIAF